MANSLSNSSSSFMLPATLQSRFQGELKPNKAVNDLMRDWSMMIAEDVTQKATAGQNSQPSVVSECGL